MSTLIRGAKVVDGTGGDAKCVDILIRDGLIADIGALAYTEPFVDEVVDAENFIVTPGFIDPHTHYDGQATWDDVIAPSSGHGVTTLVMGNCGVGFAPARESERQFLIELMEGVEDIPGSALNAGIQWDWETFPDYLNALAQKSRTVDVATQCPHGPLRLFVFGKDSNVNAPALQRQIEAMAALAGEAVSAGAFGFSTNRIAMHTSIKGESVPGTFADKSEVLAIAKAVRDSGAPLIQTVPQGLMGEDPEGFVREVQLYRELSLESGCAVYFTMSSNNVQPDQWREHLDTLEKANAAGARLIVAAPNRPGGVMMSWESFNIFMDRPSYTAIAHLPLAERIAALRAPKRRAAILSEQPRRVRGLHTIIRNAVNSTYFLQGALDLEPDPATSFGQHIARTGAPFEEGMYDALCDLAENAPDPSQTGFLHIFMGGYAKGDLEAIRELMTHPAAVVGAADGGAHVNVICDASYPSFMLQHWVRDRTRGPRLPLELAIELMTSRPAALYGMRDRGVIAPGKRADLNIINLERLALQLPRVVRDLPTGAPRLLQDVHGIEMTMVAGTTTFRNGADTGARPGRLLRRSSAQQA